MGATSAGWSAPSSAQKGEVVMLSASIAELGRAGEYAEAIPNEKVLDDALDVVQR